MDKDKIEKLVIIGSGPAGLTAAIYAARGGLDPIVVPGSAPGGQPMMTLEIDDYPGFPDGVKGSELMTKFRAQATRFGTRFFDEVVTEVDFKHNPFIIKTSSGDIQTLSVVIASGASAKWLGLPAEKRLIGRGVSVCAVCDGPFFKNKEIVVVGGGDAAMREAVYLSKLASKVTIIHRRSTFRAQEVLQELVTSKHNIKIIWNSIVENILGEEKVEEIKIKNIETGKVHNMKTEGVFVAIGHQPNTEFLKGQLDLDKKGYVKVDKETHTSVPGVFVAGDAGDSRYRQIVTAAGSGCQAVLDAEEYLMHS